MDIAKETSGPSAMINKKVVGSRMQELEEIYMRPRIEQKEIKPRDHTMQFAIDSLDVTKQLQNIHHMKPVNQSISSNQVSGIDIRSQN